MIILIIIVRIILILIIIIIRNPKIRRPKPLNPYT